MSDAFTDLERELRHGVRRLSGAGGRMSSLSATRLALRPRRLRELVLAVVLLLATATIALAASGVILTGAPVRPEEALNPGVGEGLPAPGGAELLPLRVSDPSGGPPWGMRLVTTTRGELCVQIGRVEDGQLGVLGIDGAFKDDNAFHPLPPNALPRDVYHGHPFDSTASETVSCHLAGQAVAGEHIGVDRSAAPKSHGWLKPISQLRDVYYGLLGKHALSVRYSLGHASQTKDVLPPTGAYLIVTPMRSHQQAGYGSEGLGTEGQLPPSTPFSRIVYNVAGHPCERGPSLAPWQHSDVTNPCPQAPSSTSSSPAAPPFRDQLRVPLTLKLHIRHRRIVGATLAFTAPYAVTSAHQDYTVRSPTVCRVSPTETIGGVYESLQRNVNAGQHISIPLADPFNDCAQRTAIIEVLYGPAYGPKLEVGTIAVQRPPGTRSTPRFAPPRRR